MVQQVVKHMSIIVCIIRFNNFNLYLGDCFALTVNLRRRLLVRDDFFCEEQCVAYADELVEHYIGSLNAC